MRMTAREKEIFEVLKKEPLISQDELAQRFGITRSSAAVHISNLMKKGVILGKGYVINEQVSVVVVGESYMGIEVGIEENQTSIDVIFGGFGVELSRALANFGLNVKVITVLGNDDVGNTILGRYQEKGIDTSTVFRHAEQRSARKVMVNGEARFQEAFKREDYYQAINQREWVALNCEWLVVQPELQEEIINLTAGRDEERHPHCCTLKFMEYPARIPAHIGQYALAVLGVNGSSEIDYYAEQAAGMIKNSNQNLVFTDGSSRVFCLNEAGAHDFPLMPNQSFRVKERLPYLLAGVLYGLSCSYPLRQAVRIGIGAASGSE